MYAQRKKLESQIILKVLEAGKTKEPKKDHQYRSPRPEGGEPITLIRNCFNNTYI